jgi:hypothetical protein
VSIELALADAAKNCNEQGASATLTLRSGVQIVGKLERESGADLGTRHVHHRHGGWTTVRVEEVAAVESHR